jgi:hypothetical protein
MKINWTRAILAGLAGTIVFEVLGLVFTGKWWDIPGLLGMKLGAGLPGGVVAHYANGVILAIIYAGVGPSLWGPAWARALTYMTVQTIFGVWLFMMPLLDMGVGGIKMGAGAGDHADPPLGVRADDRLSLPTARGRASRAGRRAPERVRGGPEPHH